MKILITGGAGFVGSNLAVHCRRAFPMAEIICMDNLYRRGSELNLTRLRDHGLVFHWGDVRDSSSFPQGPVDFFLECAAEPSVLAEQETGPEYLFRTNLVGALNCLEKARQWNSRIVFLSTSRVYPIARLESHPWHEEETRFVWEDNGTTGITSRGVCEGVNMDGARSLYGLRACSSRDGSMSVGCFSIAMYVRRALAAWSRMPTRPHSSPALRLWSR